MNVEGTENIWSWRSFNRLVTFKSVGMNSGWRKKWKRSQPYSGAANFFEAVSIFYVAMWPNIWGLADCTAKHQSCRGRHPIYSATAQLDGIFFEIPPWKNRHPLHLLRQGGKGCKHIWTLPIDLKYAAFHYPLTSIKVVSRSNTICICRGLEWL